MTDAFPLEAFRRAPKRPTIEQLQDPAVMAQLVYEGQQRSREEAMEQVSALCRAGWVFEPVTENSEPWQWYWRSPPKRAGSKGRLYRSTNQAFNALQRMKEPAPERI